MFEFIFMYELIESSHAEKNLGLLVDKKLVTRQAVCTDSPESHPYSRAVKRG